MVFELESLFYEHLKAHFYYGRFCDCGCFARFFLLVDNDSMILEYTATHLTTGTVVVWGILFPLSWYIKIEITSYYQVSTFRIATVTITITMPTTRVNFMIKQMFLL